VIARGSSRCKLAVYNKSVDRVMTFKYPGANITNNGNLKEKVQAQTTKAAMITCAI
jgi:N-acetylglucosamine kinase-like BadF-type ATPase